VLKDKKVLVTGLTGNLAGSIAHALAPHNEVWGLARYGAPGQRDYWERVGVHTVVGDYTSGDFTGVPDDCDYVIHAAALCDGNEPFEASMRANAEGPLLLMAHCRKARAFLHISTVGVYAEHPDPDHEYREDDLTGSASIGHYTGSKLAGEGAVRGMARYLGLPTVIGRLGVQYGVFGQGGLLGILLKNVLDRQPVLLPKGRSNILRPISDDDVVGFLEPLLKAATVPAITVNLAGDEDMHTKDIVEHFGQLAGLQPVVELTDAFDYPSVHPDPTRRREIAGRCKVPLREGLTRMYEGLHERLRSAAGDRATHNTTKP
jgi:nucleoside-diphosphate-sugar epimerase